MAVTFDGMSFGVSIGLERFNVQWNRREKRISVFPFPEFLPQSVEGLRALSTPLAEARHEYGIVEWISNSLGGRADLAIEELRPQLFAEDALLLFVDETGDESLSDDGHPLFGLGGCAIRAGDYHEAIIRPWAQLKWDLFNDVRAPMHASRFDRKHAAAVGDFFKTNKFHRLAAVVQRTTVISGHWGPYETTGAMLLRCLASLLSRQRFTAVTAIFEASDRGDRLAKKFFPMARAHGGHGEIPLRWASQQKSAGEPGLEIADFVMHAAGGQVRVGGTAAPKIRADFRAVFREVDEGLVDFSEVIKFELRHNPEGTIDGVLIDPSTEIVANHQR